MYVSTFAQQEIEAWIPTMKKHNTVVISNPVESPKKFSSTKKRDLISIGSLVPIKNHVYLVDIMKELHDLGKQYTLTIVGEGQTRPAIEKRIAQYNLQDTITLAGFVPEGKKLIPEHKLYVQSSLLESQGIVLLEALSYGTPILAAKEGGAAEIITQGKNGYYIPLDNPKKAATIIANLLSDKKKMTAMGTYGLRQFKKNYTEQVICERLYTYIIS